MPAVATPPGYREYAGTTADYTPGLVRLDAAFNPIAATDTTTPVAYRVYVASGAVSLAIYDARPEDGGVRITTGLQDVEGNAVTEVVSDADGDVRFRGVTTLPLDLYGAILVGGLVPAGAKFYRFSPLGAAVATTATNVVAGDIAARYLKPAGGIPLADLDEPTRTAIAANVNAITDAEARSIFYSKGDVDKFLADAARAGDDRFRVLEDRVAALETPQTVIPGVPTNLKAVAVSPTQVELSWSPPTSGGAVATYEVDRSGTLIAGIKSATYSNTGLTANTTYTYTVRARNAAGASAYSTAVSVKTPTAGLFPAAGTGALWGWYQGGNGSPKTWENHVERKFDVVHRYVAFNEKWPNTEQTSLAQEGRIVHFAWETRTYSGSYDSATQPAPGYTVPTDATDKSGSPSPAAGQKGWTYAQILNGSLNTYIDQRAAAVKALPGRHIIDFQHECENHEEITPGDKSPQYWHRTYAGSVADFARAFRYIRGRFEAAGVTNVTWMVNYAGWTFPTSAHHAGIRACWPGRSTAAGGTQANGADCAAFNRYNSRTATGWKSFTDTIASSYNAIPTIFDPLDPGIKDVPWGIGELGCVVGDTRRPAWFRGIPTEIKNFPRLRYVNYWSSQTSSVSDFRVHVNPPATVDDMDAYRDAGIDDYLDVNNRYGGTAPASTFTEAWTGTDGASWDTNRWTTSHVNGAATTIQTNRGRLSVPNTSGAVARVTATAASMADQDLLVSYIVANTTNRAYQTFWLRGSGDWTGAGRPNNGYRVQIQSDSSTIVWGKSVANTTTDFTSVVGANSTTAGAKQWIRFQAVGTTIRFRTWLDGNAEPTTWAGSVTDTDVASGKLQISLARAGSGTLGANDVDLDDLTLA